MSNTPKPSNTKKLITGGILAGLLFTTGAAGVVYAQSTGQTATISHQQAVEIALAEVPGNVVETDLERDWDGLVYEIEIRTADGGLMEVEIDADTGNVLEISAEDDEDCSDERRHGQRHLDRHDDRDGERFGERQSPRFGDRFDDDRRDG